VPRDLAACTIVDKRHLPLARVLAQSFLAHHPEIPFYTLLADELVAGIDPDAGPGHMLPWSAMPSPWREQLPMRHRQPELSYAATALLLGHLLDSGFRRIVFLKQETLVLGPIDTLFDALDRHSLVLTPHLLDPLESDDATARELNVLQSGVFNGGVVGVSATAPGRRFIEWWRDRCAVECRHAIGEGLHYEQRWLDFGPVFVDDCLILRDPAYNVGHWNLPERRVTIAGDQVSVEGHPCRVFRFSGYSPDAPDVITKYSSRLSPHALGAAWSVFERYRAAVEQAGWAASAGATSAFDAFDNGVRVPGIARTMYAELGDTADRFGNPFRTGAGSFFEWLTTPAAESPPIPAIPRLWRWIYEHRPDVRLAYPDVDGEHGAGFLAWAHAYGMQEVELPEEFRPASRS
jgi:hypothetical protein